MGQRCKKPLSVLCLEKSPPQRHINILELPEWSLISEKNISASLEREKTVRGGDGYEGSNER